MTAIAALSQVQPFNNGAGAVGGGEWKRERALQDERNSWLQKQQQTYYQQLQQQSQQQGGMASGGQGQGGQKELYQWNYGQNMVDVNKMVSIQPQARTAEQQRQQHPSAVKSRASSSPWDVAVPKDLPMRGEVPIAGGDPKKIINWEKLDSIDFSKYILYHKPSAMCQYSANILFLSSANILN